MIAAQGGDPDAAAARAAARPDGDRRRSPAGCGGWTPGPSGVAAWRLGAGRARKEDPVSAGGRGDLPGQAGRPGRGGAAVLELRADEEPRFGRALSALDGAIEVGASRPRRGRWSSSASRPDPSRPRARASHRGSGVMARL